MTYLFDVLALVGIVMIGAGIGVQFGWPYSLITVGTILLIAALKGAKINDIGKDTKSP